MAPLRSSEIAKKSLCVYSKHCYICTPFLEELHTDMANHKSALKRIRANDARRVRNKYYHKTTRNAIKRLRELTDKTEAQTLLKDVSSMLDKLAKKNVIHSSKAGNIKSKLTKHVGAL